ncbi:conserved hypothetical protein [Candidatus Sulfotelmatobacter kueseliae]|uniref:Uncharacterized protein n=1 Tax=Candidatus Sulfotelmatobacter kueseliae TaxID=2042962 RepID=A0A2U3K5Z7_9BACT|nr:conserved hypothetical protein [Candidatus Sulfotelmatobacter kueseliae]
MANTHLLKTRVEPFVRDWLSGQYRQKFTSVFLPLTGCSGVHEFDAVSADKRIVCGIKSSSGVTSGGKNPSGKISGAYEELYFLASVDADQRFLVLTDEEFYRLLSEKMREKLTRQIKLLYCPLTEELAQLVKKIRSHASGEIDRGKPSARAKDAGR